MLGLEHLVNGMKKESTNTILFFERDLDVGPVEEGFESVEHLIDVLADGERQRVVLQDVGLRLVHLALEVLHELLVRWRWALDLESAKVVLHELRQREVRDVLDQLPHLPKLAACNDLVVLPVEQLLHHLDREWFHLSPQDVR